MAIEAIAVHKGQVCLCELWQTKSGYIRSLREEMWDLSMQRSNVLPASYMRFYTDDIVTTICFSQIQLKLDLRDRFDLIMKPYVTTQYKSYELQDVLTPLLKQIAAEYNESVTSSLENIETAVSSHVASLRHRGETLENLQKKTADLLQLSERFAEGALDLKKLGSEQMMFIAVILVILFFLFVVFAL